jgi:hypothetical protein
MFFQYFPEVDLLKKKWPDIFNIIQLQNGLVGIFNTYGQFRNGFAPVFQIISQSLEFGINICSTIKFMSWLGQALCHYLLKTRMCSPK